MSTCETSSQPTEHRIHVPGETLHRLIHAYKRTTMNAMQAADMPMPMSHKRVLKWIIKLPGITAQQMAEKSGQDKGLSLIHI